MGSEAIENAREEVCVVTAGPLDEVKRGAMDERACGANGASEHGANAEGCSAVVHAVASE